MAIGDKPPKKGTKKATTKKIVRKVAAKVGYSAPKKSAPKRTRKIPLRPRPPRDEQ
ncbi:MAG: hypothetical protein JWM36_3207 [Hyphomicrobiales bacterium]|nr:hypothetical protein [Hyphomicrobiales bacterium]